MTDLETRKTDLTSERDHLPQEHPVLLHPGLADIYRQTVAVLTDALHDVSAQAEAASLIRMHALITFGTRLRNLSAVDCVKLRRRVA